MDGQIYLQPIARHKFPEFIVKPSVELYANLSCGFRGVVKIMSILQENFNWKFDCVPNRTGIENWLKKGGYLIYKEPVTEVMKVMKEKYAMIVDESTMFGGQSILMTLSVESEKKKGRS